MARIHEPIVTMRSLGKMGRFGNQIFQYAFLKTYANKFNLRVETPQWIGQYLFGHHDPPIGKKLPIISEKDIVDKHNLFHRSKPNYINNDFKGYFLLHTKCYAPYKSYFYSLFEPVPKIKALVEKGTRRLRRKGRTVVGLHLRRGDYLLYQNDDIYKKLFPVVPNQWYIDWLKTIWGSLNDPVLFIASDETDKVLSDFQEFDPITSRDLSLDLPEASFYPDFYILTQCDILAIAYSTFSFSASMLNSRGKMFVRPIMEMKKLIPYDPWNSKVKPYQKDIIL